MMLALPLAALAADRDAGSAAERALSVQPPSADTQPRWVGVPRVAGRVRAADLGLVINTADPYSVEVGEYYVRRRGLMPQQVLRVELSLDAELSAAEFEALRQRIDAYFGPTVQALALAWVRPYAVGCNSITAALALGFDQSVCASPCAPTRTSPYANSPSTTPYSDLGLRPTMLIAARDVAAARRLIDRGVASDFSLGLRGAPPVQAFFMSTDERARNVRTLLYPPAGLLRAAGVEIVWVPPGVAPAGRRVLMVQTGSARLPALDALSWVDGGVGDHLTSFGGQLAGHPPQSSALEWMDSGATASYGTVSEPCNHLQKFPHPQWLLLHYLQGSSAIEAYWKSVQWPQQGLFIGEPLAAPFARRP